MSGGLHIAQINFPAFYVELFPSLQDARAFYLKIRDLPPQKNAATMVFHQAARMVWLADQIDVVARGRPAFQILFYLIAAELIAKITFDVKGEGQSRKYVHRFFSEICSDESKVRLADSFQRTPYGAVTREQVVELLYKIRCNVAHEGMYYTFNLQDEGDNMPQFVQVGRESFTTNLTLRELRKMVLEGAVLAATKLLSKVNLDIPTTKAPESVT